jgi:DNA-binding GntR family transcriptional regulator
MWRKQLSDDVAFDDGAGRGGVVEFVVEETRQAINSGRLALGQRLVEADLTRQLGVSRSSVREALRRLSAEGLIDIVPHRGAAVRRFTRKEVADRYQIRIPIEALAAEFAARRIREGDNEARFLKAMRLLPEEEALGPVEGYRVANLRFHRIIASLSGNPQLATFIEQLWVPSANTSARDALGLTRWTESIREHERIGEAILRGDTAEAATAMRDHLCRGCERFLSAPEGVFG